MDDWEALVGNLGEYLDSNDSKKFLKVLRIAESVVAQDLAPFEIGTVCEYHPEVVSEEIMNKIWRLFLNMLDCNKHTVSVKKSVLQGMNSLFKHFGDELTTMELNGFYNKLVEYMKTTRCEDECIEYQNKFVYPCQESLTPNGGEVRVNHCNRKPEDLILGGENARVGEFPHMVLLSYDNTTTKTSTNDIHCGGALISDRFVLTAAHCTYSRIRGPIRRIRIGFLKMSDPVDMNNEYTVNKVYKHTNYKSPIEYNDIALLESDRPMNLNRFAVPVCLHDGSSINDDEVYAAGWGTVRYMANEGSDTLQKVILEKFSDGECLNNYPPNERRHMIHGYDSQMQVCYGHRTSSKDSCQGDSGGPVQIKHPQLRCMYLATGIVSIGTRCGIVGVPGIYTRIAYYLDWIESIVWP